ncbi:MAG: hypothetical protein RI955_1437 [Bacteroidota bacterium]|jgi:hypothetical protein
MKYNILFIFCFFFSVTTFAQTTHTAEDSLAMNQIKKSASTTIGGYGEARYTYSFTDKTAFANLDRAVLFVGHKFNNKISFFSELEVEDAKVSGGEPGGEVALEQAYVKFMLNKNTWLQAGVFIPRMGILNENHLPTTFNGVDRTFTETFVIPSTWREVGIGLYGNVQKIQGLQYSIALVNGLNSAGFESGSGIREGRFEARNATATNLALTGALLYYKGNFRMQLSGYVGGSAGLSPRVADSLQLSSGMFGTPVMMGDFNIQYHAKGFAVKFLASAINISDAEAINRAYANNTANLIYGGYAEVAYNVLQTSKKYADKKLNVFMRYENIDLNAQIPTNGISNGILKQQYIVAGATFQPIVGIIVKADYVLKQTGEPNSTLVVNQFPQQAPYQKQQGFFNVGLGYSF